jgi:hypothetical protein
MTVRKRRRVSVGGEKRAFEGLACEASLNLDEVQNSLTLLRVPTTCSSFQTCSHRQGSSYYCRQALFTDTLSFDKQS